MESFYQNWIKKNEEANKLARDINNLSGNLTNIPDTVQNPQAISNPPTPRIASIPRQEIVNDPTQETISNNPTQLTIGSNRTQNIPLLNDIVFRNDSMELYIERANHIRQTRFRLDDHMFHIKIKLINPNANPPYLRDILDFLERAFNYILTNIRGHYKTDDHNIAFLTLYQKPMINGLNTGGFDIQEDSQQMVERVLTMLEQFLVSNQTLKLDQTFQVYLKVLSVKHMVHKMTVKPSGNKKRTKEYYKKKKHYGARRKPTKLYNYFWALDVPNSFQSEPTPNIFENKCLLTATILGILQNDYFKSKRVDKRFLHVQNINSVNSTKKNRAGKILLQELNKLYLLTHLPKSGPYELEETTKSLHQSYKCQFFIFDGIDNSNKIIYMYPEEYEDNLIPIYLYQPNNDKKHVVFIRNLNSYFKANRRLCFGCKRIFMSHNYRHLCPKRKCCFSCRRFFQSKTTYIHEKLLQDFCDKNVTEENEFTCDLCNVTCYSRHCFKGHKKMCNGKGTFGFKCLTCNKFTYRGGNQNGNDVKLKHKCNEQKKCIFCHETQEENHLCKLTKEVLRQFNTKLAFIGMEHVDNSSENCVQCMILRKGTELFCDKHQYKSVNSDEPLLVTIYYEENKKGSFSKYEINNIEHPPKTTKLENILSFYYSEDELSNSSTKKNKKNYTQDFMTNWEKLQLKETILISDLLLQLIMSWRDTTFICQDEDSICYVSLPIN